MLSWSCLETIHVHKDKLQVNKSGCPIVPGTAGSEGCWWVLVMEADSVHRAWVKQHPAGSGKRILEQGLCRKGRDDRITLPSPSL